MAETIINQNLPPEYIQKAYTDLLKNVGDYVGGAQPLPDFELAGMSPAQQQAIDTAYETGGVMEGYNKVSALGEGALATVNERIANREANVSNPDTDKTLQELKNLRDTLDPKPDITEPITYVQDPDTGDAKIAEEIATKEREARESTVAQEAADRDAARSITQPDFREDYLGDFGSPIEYNELDDIESQATALEEALGVSPTTYETPAPTYSYEGSDEQDEAEETASRESSGRGRDTDVQQSGVSDPTDRGGGGGSSGGGGACVIATHAVDSGAFTPETKREAVRWCIKNLHRTWWGEAVRRGYRYYGQKAIDEGKAKNHYQEFKDYVAFGTGRKRTLKTAWTFVYRTIQFFIKGITIKNAKR
jgi:hypothetical protein